MPFYEYRCKSCGHVFEAMQRMSDAPLSDCPACHQPDLIKLISAAGFRLKGGGWYETDFKSGTKKNVQDPADKKPAPAGDAAGKSASAAPSKPAAAAPSAAD